MSIGLVLFAAFEDKLLTLVCGFWKEESTIWDAVDFDSKGSVWVAIHSALGPFNTTLFARLVIA